MTKSNSSRKIKIKCSQCGKDIYRFISKKNIGNNFCSRKCQGEWKTINLSGENSSAWKGNKITTHCSQCGVQFDKYPYQIKRAKNHFCSRKCKGIWGSINLKGKNSYSYKGKIKVNCVQCDKQLEKIPAKVNLVDNHFCSNKCRGIWMTINRSGENSPQWRGGISDQGYCSTWTDSEFKSYIFERDNYRCQNPQCLGNGSKLHRHHVNYNKKDCKPTNIITVCDSCNFKANKDREWHTAYYQAIILKKKQLLERINDRI